MQTKSGEWWDYSWNVAPGCTKVSQECQQCWALAMAKRLSGMNKPGYEGLVYPGGQWTGKVNLLYRKLMDPLKLKRPRVIAVNLMGDLFHETVPISFIQAVFQTMRQVNWHTYMVLTKRPERMMEIVKGASLAPLPNIWLGATAGTQKRADASWSSMAWLAQQGWKTWVSSEPRLEGIDWRGWSFLKMMVTGGESGPYARPMSPAWPRWDRDWCLANGVQFHFKQWGEWGPYEVWKREVEGGKQEGYWNKYSTTKIGGEMLFRYGRKMAGRVLDGCVWNAEIGGEE